MVENQEKEPNDAVNYEEDEVNNIDDDIDEEDFDAYEAIDPVNVNWLMFQLSLMVEIIQVPFFLTYFSWSAHISHVLFLFRLGSRKGIFLHNRIPVSLWNWVYFLFVDTLEIG